MASLSHIGRVPGPCKPLRGANFTSLLPDVGLMQTNRHQIPARSFVAYCPMPRAPQLRDACFRV